MKTKEEPFATFSHKNLTGLKSDEKREIKAYKDVNVSTVLRYNTAQFRPITARVARRLYENINLTSFFHVMYTHLHYKRYFSVV